MPQFYLRAAMETKPKTRLAAVCYQRIESGGSPRHFKVLLADEWGEKEILRKLKDMGLFELGQLFVPVGPNLEDDMSLMVSRGVHHGILRFDEKAASDFVRRKLQQTARQNAAKEWTSAEHERESSGKESNKQIVERLCREGEAFLRECMAVSG